MLSIYISKEYLTDMVYLNIKKKQLRKQAIGYLKKNLNKDIPAHTCICSATLKSILVREQML